MIEELDDSGDDPTVEGFVGWAILLTPELRCFAGGLLWWRMPRQDVRGKIRAGLCHPDEVSSAGVIMFPEYEDALKAIALLPVAGGGVFWSSGMPGMEDPAWAASHSRPVEVVRCCEELHLKRKP